ncbi:hypothetical protein BKA57DRAFT_449141 [Linnemannia elongata]|nr:hypothetical protein BKA57DRAFT_449141 [Linnemannia elongata]
MSTSKSFLFSLVQYSFLVIVSASFPFEPHTNYRSPRSLHAPSSLPYPRRPQIEFTYGCPETYPLHPLLQKHSSTLLTIFRPDQALQRALRRKNKNNSIR